MSLELQIASDSLNTVVLGLKKTAYLHLEYVCWKDPNDPTWQPLPEGVLVAAIAEGADPGQQTPLGTGKTDAAGNVTIELSARRNDWPISFRVESKGSDAASSLPLYWTTAKQKTTDGVLGCFDMRDPLGTSCAPLQFKMGFLVVMQLKYRSVHPQPTPPLVYCEHTVPNGIEVNVRARSQARDFHRRVQVWQYDETKAQLCQNAFPPPAHDDTSTEGTWSTHRVRRGSDGPDEPETEPPDGIPYSKSCALVGTDGWVRCVLFDLDSAKEPTFRTSRR